jgi:hypothetical protein
VKEQLFACGKNKIRAAVDALQYFVLEVHPSPHSPDASRSFSEVGNFRTCECAQSRYAPPLNYPWIRPTCACRRSTTEEPRDARMTTALNSFRTGQPEKKNGSPPLAVTHR